MQQKQRCDNNDNKENAWWNVHAKGDDHPLSYIKEQLGPKNLSEKSTCDKDEIFVSESNNADLSNILESVFPNASDKIKVFLKSQYKHFSLKLEIFKESCYISIFLLSFIK